MIFIIDSIESWQFNQIMIFWPIAAASPSDRRCTANILNSFHINTLQLTLSKAEPKTNTLENFTFLFPR